MNRASVFFFLNSVAALVFAVLHLIIIIPLNVLFLIPT